MLQRSTVYALPYGDLDLAAAARHDPAVYTLARTRSTEALKALGVVSLPMDAPITGYLQTGAVNLGDSSTPLLLSDQAVSGTVPAAATLDGRSILTTSSLVADGGPPPGDTHALVPVRQELLALAFLGRPKVTGRVIGMGTEHIAEFVDDPDLRAAVTPTYSPGCKRLLISNDWYPTLVRPDVDLVTSPIERIAPEGVVTAGGELHRADTLVLGTGFAATDFLAPMKVFGRNGVELSEHGRATLLADRARRDAWLARRLKDLTPDERAVLRRAAPILERLSTS